MAEIPEKRRLKMFMYRASKVNRARDASRHFCLLARTLAQLCLSRQFRSRSRVVCIVSLSIRLSVDSIRANECSGVSIEAASDPGKVDPRDIVVINRNPCYWSASCGCRVVEHR